VTVTAAELKLTEPRVSELTDPLSDQFEALL
jgi:hypothetical protein